ncbi:uncharacterized protein LOC116009778 [Ipomoea triloba]|uniref:uncharacterized protein LOC116009778 n=1 Tax=Ipomoea triloba TaxID=35885 RepID=UPI00125D11B6|nr:uncharacterized protein LOC116009778 [Ipomoea triloba]
MWDQPLLKHTITTIDSCTCEDYIKIVHQCPSPYHTQDQYSCSTPYMDNYPSPYEYPPPPYQFERAHAIYSYDPHDAQYTNEPPPYANEPYKQSYFEDPYHNNPPLHSFDGNEFQERELQEEWNALKNDTLQPLKQMEEQLAFMMKELTTRTQGEDHASTLGSGETIPEISWAKDDPMLEETPVLEEAPIHQLEDQTGVEIESVNDEEVELVWEDEEPNGDLGVAPQKGTTEKLNNK